MSDVLSAVIVAAGRSRRFNQSHDLRQHYSKILIEWKGAPLFVHSISALLVLPISKWVIVVSSDDRRKICLALKEHFPQIDFRIVEGGGRRQDSVRNGIESLESSDRVLIHDAARPFVSAKMLERLDEASALHSAVIPVLPVVETLKEVDSQGVVVRTHPRERFVRVQTPQFFHFQLIADTHRQLKDDPREFTDDAMMIEEIGEKVFTVAGDIENSKVTTVEDLNVRGIYV